MNASKPDWAYNEIGTRNPCFALDAYLEIWEPQPPGALMACPGL
jgi:hypothetical protein